MMVSRTNNYLHNIFETMTNLTREKPNIFKPQSLTSSLNSFLYKKIRPSYSNLRRMFAMSNSKSTSHSRNYTPRTFKIDKDVWTSINKMRISWTLTCCLIQIHNSCFMKSLHFISSALPFIYLFNLSTQTKHGYNQTLWEQQFSFISLLPEMRGYEKSPEIFNCLQSKVVWKIYNQTKFIYCKHELVKCLIFFSHHHCNMQEASWNIFW